MYILVTSDGEISLQDSDNLRAFSIVEEQPGGAKALASIGVAAEEQHYWLDAEAVIALSGRENDPQWVGQFWGMLAQVETYGYSNMTTKQVKAHIESA